jgi:hypothetical protein
VSCKKKEADYLASFSEGNSASENSLDDQNEREEKFDRKLDERRTVRMQRSIRRRGGRP